MELRYQLTREDVARCLRLAREFDAIQRTWLDQMLPNVVLWLFIGFGMMGVLREIGSMPSWDEVNLLFAIGGFSSVAVVIGWEHWRTRRFAFNAMVDRFGPFPSSNHLSVNDTHLIMTTSKSSASFPDTEIRRFLVAKEDAVIQLQSLGIFAVPLRVFANQQALMEFEKAINKLAHQPSNSPSETP